MSIKVENLSFRYQKHSKQILENLNLEIENGKVVVLLGLNGCGKTTLIKNIVGIEKPNEGMILIDGKDASKMSNKERSKYIAYVSQKTANLDDVNIRDYLSYSFANKVSIFGKPNDEQMNKIDDYAKQFGIEALLNKSMDEISGGERQIVSICSALLQDTNIIVLDEPTSALDLVNQNKVLNCLSKIAKDEDKTIILSSHNPNHALQLGANVALMKDGNIVQYGLSNDIIIPEVLKEVYGDNICYSMDLDYKEISFKEQDNDLHE